ncbi:MAG TPA: nuclear transport factor 2 family protein, partial [Longimicrobiaceae bacterium]|nr:nuclear transport factor 2 family protein [Longimicrobiaceae bacterium]
RILVRPPPTPETPGDAVHRITGTVLCATLLLAACKVERTPRRFYSQRDPAAAERELFTAELTDRVAAVGPALDRRDAGGALFALAPAPDVHVIGPEGGIPAVGPDRLAAVLLAVTDTVPATVSVHDVRVALGPRAQTGWFSAGVEVLRPGAADPAGAADTLRFSGVYLRNRGEWRLMQAHLSRAFTPPAAPQPSPPDSAGRGAAAPAEAPPT